jgi:4-amino-4-deoxy-L-arabinose transferase-like glycosyltransferase
MLSLMVNPLEVPFLMQTKHHSSKVKHHLQSSKSPGKKKNLHQRKDYRSWIILTIIILFTAAIRIRLLSIPLERDEGEFAYMGQLMLQGIPPYLIAYNMKLPGIYAIYALIMAIFGQTITGIHLGLIVANSIAIVLLFLLTRYLFDKTAAIVAAISYALLSLSPSVLGTSAHATQFIVPFALGGTILLLKAIDSKSIKMFFISGLLFGLAFIIKQHAIFFIAFALFYFTQRIITVKPIDKKQLIVGNSLLLIGAALPFLFCCAILYNAGVFAKFWFWTFTYASEYASIVSLPDALQIFMVAFNRVVDSWSFLWIIAGIGLTSIFWNDKARTNRYLLLGFFFFSFLTVCPGFYFRDHYFITLLPVIAMLAGIATTALIQWLHKKKIAPFVEVILVFIIAAAIIYPVSAMGNFFFNATPTETSRLMYGLNPFPESIKIAEYIKAHTKKDERIAVIGSEPQIYFYADRKSATGYIYTYGLMEPHIYASKMQLEFIREIETSRPEYIVFVNVTTSWLPEPDSDMTIIKWAETFLKQNYTTVGLADGVSEDDYRIYWDEEARRNKPLSPNNLFVLKLNIKQNTRKE